MHGIQVIIGLLGSCVGPAFIAPAEVAEMRLALGAVHVVAAVVLLNYCVALRAPRQHAFPLQSLNICIYL